MPLARPVLHDLQVPRVVRAIIPRRIPDQVLIHVPVIIRAVRLPLRALIVVLVVLLYRAAQAPVLRHALIPQVVVRPVQVARVVIHRAPVVHVLVRIRQVAAVAHRVAIRQVAAVRPVHVAATVVHHHAAVPVPAVAVPVRAADRC